MKKVTTALLALLMALTMCACGGQANAPSDDTDVTTNGEASMYSDKTFVAAMTASPTSLDEGYSSNAHCRQASTFIFETLYSFDEEYEVIPQLAESYTISEDKLTYVFKLREGITFHDGSAFDATDVVASVERYKTTAFGTNLSAVESVEALSDYEVQFNLSAPVELISLLAFPQRVIIIPSEIAETHMDCELTDSDNSLIGTGPYKVVKWVRDSEITLERFEDYALDERYDDATGFGGKRIAYYKTVKLQAVPESESRMAGLETGEFDYAEAIPATSYNRITENEDLNATIVCPKWGVCVELNHAQWPTSDVNFRRALVYALDMEEVLKAVTTNNETFYRLDSSLYQPEQFYYTEAGAEGIYNCKDLDKVKECLDAAGYQGEEIVYLCNQDFEWMYKAGLSLVEQWQAAGINVKVEYLDWTSQIAKATTLEGWNINQTGYSVRLDPTQLRSCLYSTASGAYGYNNPDMDALLDEIALGNTSDVRKGIWEDIQQLVWDDVALIKMGDYLELEAISADCEGYRSFFLPRFWNVTD